MEKCQNILNEYSLAVIFHLRVEHDQCAERNKQMQRMIKMEREVFLSGYYNVFLIAMGSCNFCRECTVEGTRENA